MKRRLRVKVVDAIVSDVLTTSVYLRLPAQPNWSVVVSVNENDPDCAGAPLIVPALWQGHS